jgi:hypothetical protein
MLNRVRVSFGLRALHRRAKAVRRVNDLGRRRSLDADTAIRMWGSALTLVNRPSSTVATTPCKCTWHSRYGSCWMVMEVTIVVLFYETVTHHGNPSASEPQPKDPPLTSPPSRGREERGHAIGGNSVSSNDEPVRNLRKPRKLSSIVREFTEIGVFVHQELFTLRP